MQEDLLVEIDRIIERIEQVPTEKRYWLIRTQSGKFYESFRNHGFVALEHEKISLFEINLILQKFPASKKLAVRELKDLAARRYPDEKQPGIIAGQLYNFVIELRKGDIVVIPSENSDIISIGEVKSYIIPELTDSELKSTECDYKKRKLVNWIKDVRKSEIDPFLWKMLQSHQAINNISHYGEVLERTIGNFFIKDEEASLILEVQSENEINAKQLFSLGHYLLEYAEKFIYDQGLPLDIGLVDVKINLNSPGKIQLKAPNARTIWLIAVLAVCVSGGGLKVKYGDFDFDLSTDGVMKRIIEYQNNSQDRVIVEKLSKSMDSLKVLPPTDAIEVIKQFSTNKDLPK